MCSHPACVIVDKHIGSGAAQWLPWEPSNIPRQIQRMGIKRNITYYYRCFTLSCFILWLPTISHKKYTYPQCHDVLLTLTTYLSIRSRLFVSMRWGCVWFIQLALVEACVVDFHIAHCICREVTVLAAELLCDVMCLQVSGQVGLLGTLVWTPETIHCCNLLWWCVSIYLQAWKRVWCYMTPNVLTDTRCHYATQNSSSKSDIR